MSPARAVLVNARLKNIYKIRDPGATYTSIPGSIQAPSSRFATGRPLLTPGEPVPAISYMQKFPTVSPDLCRGLLTHYRTLLIKELPRYDLPSGFDACLGW